MEPPKIKALRVQPQSLKETLANHNNVTPFKSRTSIEKRHLHSIKHKSHSNIDTLDILEGKLKNKQLSQTELEAACSMLRKNTEHVLSIGELYK